ncbi:MAG: hypothetical protein ACP5E2_10760 [Terracidiphilus sp.]
MQIIRAGSMETLLPMRRIASTGYAGGSWKKFTGGVEKYGWKPSQTPIGNRHRVFVSHRHFSFFRAGVLTTAATRKGGCVCPMSGEEEHRHVRQLPLSAL